jgi:hypothetical protein
MLLIKHMTPWHGRCCSGQEVECKAKDTSSNECNCWRKGQDVR